MLWGVTLRSPHPSARILSVDITEALKTAGVFAVLTHDDVPGAKYYGLEHQDQPVLAIDVVRYQGEPIALVAADHPETARQAMKKIVVEYDVLEPIVDAEKALLPDSPRLHPDGNLVRHVKIRVGDPSPTAEVVVSGDYEVGMQDQAFLGPESGLAVPDDVGGVDLFVATQWLHADQRQVCSALGLGPDQVRLRLSGVGGAFGGREDLSMHVHGCLLALHTRKPVKMVYNREESFFGHVHRHPASMHYEYGADRDGKLVYARVTIHLDGGAYASSTPAVVGNAGHDGTRPLRDPEHPPRLLRLLHEQPALRRHARVRLGADRVRGRGDHGQACRRGRRRSRRDPGPQRVHGRLDGTDRADHRQRRTRRRAGPAAEGDADA